MKHLIIRLIPAIVVGILAIAGMDFTEDVGSGLAKAERLLKRDRVQLARKAVDAAIDGDMLRYNSIAFHFYDSTVEPRQAKTIQILIDQAGQLTADRELSQEEWILYHCGTAMLYDTAGRVREAEVEYKRALALETNSAQLLNMLGWFYAEEGTNLEEAVRLLQRAVQLAPDDAMIIDSLGWAYHKLGDHKKAIAVLRRAVELQPEEAELRYHLGAAYAKSDRRLQAVIELNKALILDPSMPEPQTLLKTLK